ncbi:MAG: bacillithiol biosynthesis deacetylase BshB1 [Coriobacteriia bacterium]|nr:bacillithiol biosynthesis deacetylase BshB1 [Coriobacteriia bacterium]
MADVICFGAHPDDVEIGMGATAAKLARCGLDVLIVDLTDGEPTPRGTHETRMVEAATSAVALGARRLTLDLPNRELFDTVEARKKVAEVLRAERPRIVFAPYPIDAHPDHIAASAIIEAARFYAKFVKTDMAGEPHYPARLYHYWAVHLRIVERPSFIVDVSEDLDAKMVALAAYESQFTTNEANVGILPWVRVQAASWGALIGTAAGEPFYAREQIGVRDVRDLL